MTEERHAPFVVLGVTGGIAAYKAVEICRQLVDAGCHVAPILTPDAQRFIAPLTFTALASEPAQTELYNGLSPIPHTRLGQNADLILITPCTAHLIARYAHGLADDLLTNTLLATRAPVMIAPAMHTEMWEQASVQDNLALLRSRGVHVVEPGVGRLAGGDVGQGRLAEPDDIVAAALALLRVQEASQDLAGKRVLITAGGTREAIDPVRYVTNRSSGKQGHALAEEALARGAEVTLITTANVPVHRHGAGALELVRVETAAEMYDAVLARSATADVIVMAAAVADFRPVRVSDVKMKKEAGTPHLELEPTQDILLALGAGKSKDQVIVGFAAETDQVLEHARAKLERKGCDFLVVNDVSAPSVGFDHDTNEVTILGSDGSTVTIDLASKRTISKAIFDRILSY